MNHRDLMISARKRMRFAISTLPEDLQDAVIDGLDGQTLTLMEASALCKSRGYTLSHEAIASYYRALRIERRLLEIDQQVPRLVESFADKSTAEIIETVAKLILSTAAVGVADGSVGIKAIDLGKILQALPGAKAPAPMQDPDKPAEGSGKSTGLSPEAADKIRREILGIK